MYYTLQLIKGKTYKNASKKIEVSKDKPILKVESKKDLDELLETGFFKLISKEKKTEKVK